MSYSSHYKGWSVDYDAKPIPYRGADWTATSPDYDCDCDEDGFFVCAGTHVEAETFEELCERIDEVLDEVGDA